MADALFSLPTRIAIKARLLLIVQALERASDGTLLDPPLPVNNWVPGDPSERWLEILPRMVDMMLSNQITQVVRGFFLELQTDPGDPGDLSADQTPRAGWLSAVGLGWYGVQRGEAGYAAGFITITNAGASETLPFKAFDLTFQRATAGSDGGLPTYRNTEDGAIYTGLGETITLLPGASLTIPIKAQQKGSGSNATPGQISACTTQSFGTLTCSNASPVLGADREDRFLYISRCRLQSAAASPNGTQDAYRYAATTGADGLPLQLGDGSGPTTVNRVQVLPNSSTGLVLIYLANPSGPATATEVSSANGNINGITIIDGDTGLVHNATPIGVRPDTVTLGPTIADPITGADGPGAAIAVGMKPSCTAKIKARPGQAPAALISEAQAAIAVSLSAFYSSPEDAPIGGVDQVAGAGVIWTSDVQDAVKDAYEGLYGLAAFVILGGGGVSTAIAVGHVPTWISAPVISSAISSSGIVLVVASDTLATNDVVQIYDVVVDSDAHTDWLTGIWVITRLSSTQVRLNGSTFPAGGTFTAAKMSHFRITVT